MTVETWDNDAEALLIIDSLYGHSNWTWAQYDRDYGNTTLAQLESIVAERLGLKSAEVQWMTPDALRQSLGSKKIRLANPEHARRRENWMHERHPGWSLLAWRDRTGLAWETLDKFRRGITTSRTPSHQAQLAKSENVPFSTVRALDL